MRLRITDDWNLWVDAVRLDVELRKLVLNPRFPDLRSFHVRRKISGQSMSRTLVKTPIALVPPVNKIDHDQIDRQLPPAILPSNLKHLLLGPVPQLTLPKPKPILRHRRHITRSLRISLQNLPRRLPPP